MRDIIENQLRSCTQDFEFQSQDWQVLPLELGVSELMRVIHKLGDLNSKSGNACRTFHFSVEIMKDKMKMCFLRDKSPRDSLELTVPIEDTQYQNYPDKVKTLLDSQESVIISSTKPFTIQSSRYPRMVTGEQLYLLVGYSKAVLVSLARRAQGGCISSLHGSNNFIGNQGENAQAISGASMNIIFNANRGYSVESLSEITFDKNAGKKLFAKAGRSKPQGDLILYFGEKSCLAEGVNGAGTETLKLQNAASLKDLGNYTSTGQDYAKVVLNYPALYDKIMSTARGFSSPTNGKMDFGIDSNHNPYVVCQYNLRHSKYVLAKYTIRGKSGTNTEVDTKDLNVLDLTTRTVVQPPNQQEVQQVERQAPAVIEIPEEGNELLSRWRESYNAYNSVRGRSVASTNPLEWFNAYLMHQIEQGNEIGQEHYELYNSLK